MVSNTDSEAWNLEVERAAPKLKVTVRADGRDWRSHLEQVSGLDVFFRQIKSINFTEIYQKIGLEPKNKGLTKSYE